MEGHSMLVDTGREVGRFPRLMHHLVFLLFGSKHTSEIFVCAYRAYHGQAAIKSCVISVSYTHLTLPTILLV